MAISGARARAQRTKCLSNVRQLGINLSVFVSDRGSYPLGSFGTAAHNNAEGFWAIDPDTSLQTNVHVVTVRRGGLWDCPSTERPDDQHGGSTFADYGYNAFGVGNTQLTLDGGLGGKLRGGEWHPVKESDVVSPAANYALGDGLVGNGRAITDGSAIMALRNLNAAETAKWERVNRRHRGRANVGFCDGHVESISLSELFSSDADAALSRWNRDHQPHRERLNR
jgi:prepilin-type processing-associated H-X9-DG protein